MSPVLGGEGTDLFPTYPGHTVREHRKEPEWLEGFRFPDYRAPGLVLLALLGIRPGWSVLRPGSWARDASLLVGLAILAVMLTRIYVTTSAPLRCGR